MRASLLALVLGLSACEGSAALDAGGGVDAAGARDAGASDAGASDAGSSDAGPPDAGAVDGGDAATADAAVTDGAIEDDARVADASTGDAGTCDPSAVRFDPPGGRLEVGQLCDTVFACADDAADAARIAAASPAFECIPEAESPCTAYTCTLRPSVLDEQEIADICLLTVIEPEPDLYCIAYTR